MDILSFLLGFKKGQNSENKDVAEVLDEVDDVLDIINGEIVGETLYTVTFIGATGETLGAVEVYERDDCPNPISNKLITTPTKDSTNTLTYSFKGWSLEPDGEVSASALNNITSNRTLYAVFSEATRYYTIRFYDGDTLLKTEKHEYGASSTYKLDKFGANFNGWTPSPTNISSDMDCVGEWVFASFTTDSWETIAMNAKAGRAAEVYSVGDVKEMTLRVPSRTPDVDEYVGDIPYTIETIVVQIAGINKDTISSSSWSGDTITLISKTPLRTPRAFNSERMDANYGYAFDGFMHSDLHDYLNFALANYINECMNSSSTKRCFMLSVDKPCTQYLTTNKQTSYIRSMQVWVPDLEELGAVSQQSSLKYEVYTDDASRIAMLDGTPVEYWTRSLTNVAIGSNYARTIMNNGQARPGEVANKEFYVIFGFCIGG